MKKELICPTCGGVYYRQVCPSRRLPEESFCSAECRKIENWSEEQKLEKLKIAYEKNVIRREGCWGWKGYIDERGCAKMSCRREFGASFSSRASWLLHIGPLEEGKFICHHCDFPECTNPDHLFLGLPKENSSDMVSKKRQAYGSRNKKAKLDDELVIEIKELLKDGWTMKSLAKMYNVNHSTIQKIKYGVTWRHLIQ